MKILHIISSLKIGGAEQALCNILDKLRKKGNRHTVAFFHAGPHVNTLEKMGITTYHITGLAYPFDPIAFYRLRKLIKHLKPDILHTSLWGANIMGRILGYFLNIPVISDLHGSSADEGTFRNTFDRWTAHIPSRTIAVSNSVHVTYQSHIINTISAKKLRLKATQSLITINNGIDVNATRKMALDKPLSRSEVGLDEYAFVVGAVGRLERIKSYDILIRGFDYARTKIPAIQLCIVGDGSERDSLKNLVKQLNLEKQIIFAGFRHDAIRYYPLFDCFALSSQSEGLSIALLEALCFGLPIITTHNSVTHDVITHGTHGFLVPPNNWQAFGKKIYEIKKNKNLQLTMKKNNSTYVATHFGLTSTCKQYLNCYFAAKNSQTENLNPE